VRYALSVGMTIRKPFFSAASNRSGVIGVTCVILATLADAHLSVAQQVSNDIQITSPTNGSIVVPGQGLSVVVSVNPKVTFAGGVQVIAENIGISQPQTNPPFQFVFTVPNEVIGPKKLTALGITGPEEGLFSMPVTVDIETSAALETVSVSPKRITLSSLGQQIPITVTGAFADGSVLDITRSSRTTFTSVDATIAQVSSVGVVTALKRGATTISILYGGLSLTVPVSVETGPSVTASASPSTLWPPNGVLIPVTVSGIVMDAGGGIRKGTGRYQVIDEYATVQPKGNLVLASNGSYSFTVFLEASRRGDDTAGRHYTITVSAKDNSGNPGSTSTTVLVPHDQGH
jgi:hypothetical protein